MRRAIEILVVATAAAAALTPFPRSAVERVYSRGLYPRIQPRLTALSNIVSVSLFDVTIVCFAAAIILVWIAGFRGAARGARLRTAGSLLLTTLAGGALLYIWFLACWGLNYRREPIRSQLDFADDRISQAALDALAVRDVNSLNGLYADAHRSQFPEFPRLREQLSAPFDRVQRDLAMRWRVTPARPKRSLLDLYFRRVAVDGMTDPFFLETLTNQSLLPFERPFVVAHEWGHLAGYADESEANFFAWLVCLRGAAGDQYSAWISLYGTIVSSLASETRDDVVKQLEAGPRSDLRAMDERIVRQVNPAASRAGYAIYDRFLKANRVRAGIRSYNEVVRLILGTRFNQDGTPVLRSR